MLASSAEIGEPCGVPASTSETIPPSNTPARSQARSSFGVCRSDTRRATWAMRASWAERFGRNLKLTGQKSASKTGSKTIFAAAMITTDRGSWGCRAARSVPACPLGDVHPPQQLRAISLLPQLGGEAVEEGSHSFHTPLR